MSFSTRQWGEGLSQLEISFKEIAFSDTILPSCTLNLSQRIWIFIPVRLSIALACTALGPLSSRGEDLTVCQVASPHNVLSRCLTLLYPWGSYMSEGDMWLTQGKERLYWGPAILWEQPLRSRPGALVLQGLSREWSISGAVTSAPPASVCPYP